MNRRLPLILSFVLAASILAGCAAPEGPDGDGGGDGSGDGSMSVYVKDAPTDEFTEIHLNFTEVLVHMSNETANATNTTSGDGWMTIVNATGGIDVNLLNATNASAAFLGEADLPAGNYTQLRIVVADAWGIDLDGNRVDITVSSGTVRVIRGFDIEEGQETRVVVDLDLDQSLVQQGNGVWRLTPVVGSTHVQVVADETSGADTTNEGEIEGNVTGTNSTA